MPGIFFNQEKKKDTFKNWGLITLTFNKEFLYLL